jgi:hypothetical protein
MKTNHRRVNKAKGGFDYSTLNFMRRWRAGLGFSDHDGGHRGSARDIREIKDIRRRQERRKLNKIVME